MSISFSYDYLESKGHTSSDSLHLRLDPNSISWQYNLNTNIVDTIGGQVVQVLSVNIDSLVIEGQFGKEGVFGLKRGHVGQRTRRGDTMPFDGLMPKDKDEQWGDKSGQFGVGLTQMTEFFRNYFARSTQGGDSQAPGRYQYLPMKVSYAPARQWEVIPVSFPSYRRSIENFAPEWKVEFEVLTSDAEVQRVAYKTAMDRLVDGIGYKAKNPFSDPLADDIDPSQAGQILDQIASNFRDMVPGFTRGELENMIWQGISVPAVTELREIDPTLVGENEINPYLSGAKRG